MQSNYQKLTPKLALQLANPPSWVASALPALFGIFLCYANKQFIPVLKAVALFICCILMQAAVNTINDYCDFKKGTDSKADVLEESDATLLYNNLNPKAVLGLGVFFILAAACLGIYGAWGSNPVPFVIGAVGGLCVIFYSCGPAPISYLPIGELLSGVVMGGLIPAAIFAVPSGGFNPVVVFASLPYIIGIGMIMLTNNCCDIEKDKKAKRNTLAVWLGRERTVKLYRFLSRLWKYLIWVLPILTVGTIGILSPLLLTISSRQQFKKLTQLPLDQPHRIECMKSIIETNQRANITYMAFVLARVMEVLS